MNPYMISIAALALVGLSLFACSTPRLELSDHSDGKKYFNQDPNVTVGKSLLQVLKWKFTGDLKEWPDFVKDNVAPDFTRDLAEGEGAVTFINHASELIQFKDLTVITDPVFSERVSPVSWFGPKRHRDPGATLDNLPKIDFVLVSHNHYDHLDLDSLTAINKRDHPTFIVPLGNRTLLEGEGIESIVELDWWQNHKTSNGSLITLVPMQHWSARGIFDRFEMLWGGFVISSSELKVLFTGDTAYNRQFKDIAEKLGTMDLSILPIGAYEPRWFMREQHMDPQDAVRAHLDLKSNLSIGTHYGTFQLTDEGIEDPITELSKALAEDDSGGEDAETLLRTHVPDHLAGSPLCPLDVRNRTGGK
ncbi:MAG: hypothetical protein EOP09_14320, partial [Proteobacteria bacterium]